MPWLFWAWCYAHRLELACKDAFSSQLFHDVEEMLLRLYYLYEKSAKKCCELEDVVVNLKVSRRSLSFPRVETYLLEHKEAAGLHTNEKLCREFVTNTVLT